MPARTTMNGTGADDERARAHSRAAGGSSHLLPARRKSRPAQRFPGRGVQPSASVTQADQQPSARRGRRRPERRPARPGGPGGSSHVVRPAVADHHLRRGPAVERPVRLAAGGRPGRCRTDRVLSEAAGSEERERSWEGSGDGECAGQGLRHIAQHMQQRDVSPRLSAESNKRGNGLPAGDGIRG